jgi:putative ABC transport system ATP-binding protein
MALIRFEQVSRTYSLGRIRVEALQAIDLSIEPGEFVGVSGPSGSGKSTLCNLIGAIDRPTAGEVRVNGRSLSSLGDDALSEHRNRSVGFVFQQFNLLGVLTAEENVMLPLQLRGASDREARERAVALLADCGLEEHRHHLPDRLSGGQRQRVAIARALVTRPPIVVADEPTANLDSDSARSILALMRQRNETDGTTFVISTHDRRMLEGVRRNVRLRDGRVADDAGGSGGGAA